MSVCPVGCHDPWNNWTRLQPVQFEWEGEPQPRAVRLVSESAWVDDLVRVMVAGVEVEARIEAVEFLFDPQWIQGCSGFFDSGLNSSTIVGSFL